MDIKEVDAEGPPWNPKHDGIPSHWKHKGDRGNAIGVRFQFRLGHQLGVLPIVAPGCGPRKCAEHSGRGRPFQLSGLATALSTTKSYALATTLP